MTTTPHHVGQVAKAEILVTHLLDTAPAGADHQRQAAVIVQQLQEAGWTPPRDLTEKPPLRPDRVADPDHRAACMDQIRAVFNPPTDEPRDTPNDTGVTPLSAARVDT